MPEDWQKWHKQLRALKEFHRLYPGRWPGQNTPFPGRNSLGAWCARQQREYKRNNLSRARLKKLLDLGFPLLTEKSQWERRRAVYTYYERGWLLRLEDLRAYRRRHPGEWPKTTNTDDRIRSLGIWLYTNRRKNLRPEFKGLLKSMGFDFTPASQKFDRQWNKQFRYLQEFRKKNPHRWPGQREEYPKGNHLGLWVANQRKKKKDTILHPEREMNLRAIGFDFNPRSQEILGAQWDKQFRYLLAFRRKNPHRWPAIREEYPEGNRLGAWVFKQRQKQKGGLLRLEREVKLSSIDFEFSFREVSWEKQFRHLQTFRKKNPNRWPTPKEEYPKGNQLGRWVTKQRQKKKTGKLHPDREEKLKTLGFDSTGPYQRTWEKQFRYLQLFLQENPYRWPWQREEYPKGNLLGVWINNQRQNKRMGLLRPDREKKLRHIGFRFSSSHLQ